MTHWDQQFCYFTERLSSLRRLKCTSIIEKGFHSVSFIESFFYLIQILYIHVPEGNQRDIWS